MMVQQTTTHRQVPPLPRRERRKIELEKYRLQKKIRKYNLSITFDNDTTTKFANFGSVEAFKQAIGFKDIISKTFTMRKAPNSKFQSRKCWISYLMLKSWVYPGLSISMTCATTLVIWKSKGTSKISP